MPSFEETLSELNNEQLKAVTSVEKPLLVLAGAGTGKTKVLTARIAYILYNGLAFPSEILAVTFTNKAAREMGTRIHNMVGDSSSGLWLGTFHSTCLKLLRLNVQAAGLEDNFAIINQDDQVRLIKQIVRDLKIDEKKYNPKGIAAQINRWKDRALEPDEVVDGDVAGNVYAEYYNRCKTMNIVDFGDLTLKTIKMFKNNDDILRKYQRKFKYILVDEYQDTNVSQYLWLRLLAQNGNNICCVGDDDQSIYGWRGAEVGNILRFEKDFPGSEVIRLETNYRSTSEILSVADHLIANNQKRLGKSLNSNNGSGEKVKVASIWDDRAEANFIANEIESLQDFHDQSLEDIAILVRAGHQTRAFEESFIKKSIPYKILGGLKFYERLEVRDAVAYIRATVQPDNDLMLERIINVPKRGIGEKTLNELRQIAREKEISLNIAIRHALQNDLLKPRIHGELANLFNHFDKWKGLFEDKQHTEVVEDIIEQSGYKAMWEKEKTIESKGRLENLKELINAIAEFRDIDEFLEHVSLVADADDRPNEETVSIMTIHGAKGLEFENVFLPGWEEGIFPSQQSLDETGKEGLEEERRLAYVAITRAKRNLYISFASSRMLFGNIISSIPSRFINELPQEKIESIGNTSTGPKFGKGGGRNSYELNDPEAGNRFFEKPKQKLFDSRNSKFSVGDKIFHNKFGFGRVININGKHLQIVFEKSSIKTLLEDFIEAA